MRKRFTKIICTAVAAISALSIGCLSACTNQGSVLSVKDPSTSAVEGTNGGFLVETQDYVYFINGVSSYAPDNTFGSVLKGSVQRILKSDVAKLDYSKSETVVPSIIYSGNHDAGIYIYDGYIYYSTPTTERNIEGAIQRTNIDFKRTKLDGSDTTQTYFYQSDNNSIDYRFVQTEEGGDVYLLYAKTSETLFSESSGVTNIHSVNCNTGANTLLAYNVSDYAFDTENVENPYVYYTMNVPDRLGKTSNRTYNQMFRVKADATESERELDFTGVEDYDKDTNPIYVNLGKFVFDGVGLNEYDRIDQLNFSTEISQADLPAQGYTYDIDCYKDGTLFYSRGSGNLHTLTDAEYDAKADWNAVTDNSNEVYLFNTTSISSYMFVELDGTQYAISAASDGIKKKEVKDNKIQNGYTIDGSSSATLLAIRTPEDGEDGHTNLYFATSGNNGGYFIKRIALDGEYEDYHILDTNDEPDKTYKGVQILDIEYDTGWYAPTFIKDTNTLVFPSSTASMSSFNYIMACDLSDSEGKLMDNNEIDAYTEQYNGVNDKINKDYGSDKTFSNGSQMYENLPAALKYLFNTRDGEYLGDLRQAFVDIEGKKLTYKYTDESAAVYEQFATATGDWAEYADKTKTVNGEEVTANFRDYYYSVFGRMTDEDAEALNAAYKSSMPSYPVDTRTWWEKLSAGEQAGFIIGMVILGLAVVAGLAVLVIFLVRKFGKKKTADDAPKKKKIDVTDDKDIDVYGDGEINK